MKLKLKATDCTVRSKPSNYPEEFARRMVGREKRQLGEAFGIQKFGVNLTTLAPGAQSALLHRHSKQEEFVYIISGTATLVTDQGEVQLEPGDCAGFTPAGPAHQLVNRSNSPVIYLEMGDRIADDNATYPNDDLVAEMSESGWKFRHKDGKPY